MKQRSVGLSILLTIITCGIYGIYWMVVLNDEINAMSGRQGATSGGTVVLLSIVTCGIYGIYWMYKMGEGIEVIHEAHGDIRGSAPILYLVLSLFGLGIVSYALMQSELNKYLPAQ